MVCICRDEVLAEWCFATTGHASLHVYCHVSGEQRWLAPPALRNYIFQREMPLASPAAPHNLHVTHRRRCDGVSKILHVIEPLLSV